MFQSISNFARRHKRKLLIFGGIAGGVYIFRKYLSSKMSAWETRQTQDFLDQMKRFHHFEGTLQTCDSTVLSLFPKVFETVEAVLKVDELIVQLKSKPEQKVQTWEELKILVFVEAISEICGEALLVGFLRVQLSVIGGYMYNDTQKNKTNGDNDLLSKQYITCSKEIQQKYLGCIHHFFGIGLQGIFHLVRDSVQDALTGVGLKDNLLLTDFQGILNKVKQSLFAENGGLFDNISKYLLPDNAFDLSMWSSTSNATPEECIYQKILLETKDILETQDFQRVLKNSLDQGFINFLDRLSECIVHTSQEKFINPHQVSVPFAKIIPVLHMQFQQHSDDACQGNSTFVQQLLQTEEARTFAANIYEAFSQPLDNDHNVRGSLNVVE